ncbi:hypothetical protein [Streptomyces sp. NBC_00102]|uniref:hypothetical protein n=1 Tax=Streptomyces sp. NBC_00102 TaxID=2975652 RepID=UPI00224DE4EB|nr:hypothetical protein [Streptomyces sp. NBC_00102]MCX5399405.1 hypothetical protein [Streptomyces sp. NBC_00102]
MSIRRTTRPQRVMMTVAMSAAVALALTGCGGDSDGSGSGAAGTPSASASPAAEDKGQQQPDTAAGDPVDPNVKLAEAQGEDGLTLVVHEVKRDAGGFVTVQAEIKNTGSETRNTAGWGGQEPAIVAKNPNSVAGATLVDKTGKKRYYVLRDTDARCLCTTAIAPLSPGGSASVFMQFPAPPDTSNEVDFTLPTFATTSLKISG